MESSHQQLEDVDSDFEHIPSYNFYTDTDFEYLRTLVEELADYKKKLATQVEEVKISRGKGEICSVITLTEKKYQVIITLLDQINETIRIFNKRQAALNTSKADKTAKFWLVIDLNSHTQRRMIADFFTLIEYRDKKRTLINTLPAFGLAACALFFPPLAVVPSAIAAFMTGVKLTLSLGTSKATGYATYPTSYACIASLSDELLQLVTKLKPGAELRDGSNVNASYEVLGLKLSVSIEEVEAKVILLVDNLTKELISLNTSFPDDLRQKKCETIASSIVEIMLAGNIIKLDSLNKKDPRNTTSFRKVC